MIGVHVAVISIPSSHSTNNGNEVQTQVLLKANNYISSKWSQISQKEKIIFTPLIGATIKSSNFNVTQAPLTRNS